MIDFIADQTKSIMFKCCEKHMNEENKKREAVEKIAIEADENGRGGVQLKLGINENGKNSYFLCEGYKKVKELDFMGVLGVRIDFKGYSLYAPSFILKSLFKLATQYKIKPENINIMCVPTQYINANGKLRNEVELFLYDSYNYVATSYKVDNEDENSEERNGISFAQLFREEDMAELIQQ